MSKWVVYLRLNSKDYNCWTFVEKVREDLAVWNTTLAEVYENNKTKWGTQITFQHIEEYAKQKNLSKVEITDLQENDLLVFGVSNTRPLHFGIYIGNNQFLHLKKNPRIDDLHEEWRNKLKVIYR